MLIDIEHNNSDDKDAYHNDIRNIFNLIFILMIITIIINLSRSTLIIFVTIIITIIIE